MKTKSMLIALVAAGIIGAGGYGVYQAGMNQGMKMAPSASAAMPSMGEVGRGAGDNPASAERKVLYWHDPMVPGPRFDKPGKSPFMDMDLVPVYADEAGDEGTVSVSPRVQQNLGIRVAPVMEESITPVVEAVGNLAYNERDIALVQARSSGFVERLFVRAMLDPVKKGQPLAELYVPDWVAAQEEYLYVKRMQGAGSAELLAAARQRMRLAGMTDDQIRRVASNGKVQARITVTAPVSGVVAELNVREGMTVMPGTPMLQINGLDTIWAYADVPENLSSEVKPGSIVEARTPSLPGQTFKGTVSAILPEVNQNTRTIRARVELKNPGTRLVPGMFATVNFAPSARENVLTVPTEAVIATGKRSIVMVAEGEGKFAPVEVQTGIESNGKTEIRKGLQAGQKVVVSGQFLLDSESSLRGSINRMSEAPPESEEQQGAIHSAEGVVEGIEDGEIILSHGPIPSLNWGEMTMGFAVAPDLPLGPIKEGDKVKFELRPLNDGTYEVVKITPMSATQGPAQGARK
jgi:Cu(I)/Ag(I) efflux system membrane fusion protein